MNNRISMFLLGATLALGFSIASYLLSNAIKSVRNDSGIKVKGYAEIPVRSDVAKWKLSIKARDPDIKLAYNKIESDLKIVINKMKSLNIPESEFKIGSASITEEREVDEKGNKTNAIEFYSVSQELTFVTSNVDKVLENQTEISALIKDGINIDIGNAAFTFSKLEETKLELLGKASQNAYERAIVMITKTGGTIGPVKSASQGVFQIVPRNSTDVSDYGSYDVTTIDKTIKAVMTMEFDIVK